MNLLSITKCKANIKNYWINKTSAHSNYLFLFVNVQILAHSLSSEFLSKQNGNVDTCFVDMYVFKGEI